MRTVSRTAAMCVVFFGLQCCISTSQQSAVPAYRADPRLAKLKGFFLEFDSPAYFLAEDFLAAADRHGLDWRLLPSISILESGGGKDFKNNNIMGWDSCRQAFPSVQAGVDIVAARLAHSQFYKTKDLDEKLAAYNPNPDYPRRAKALMRRLTLQADTAPSVN